MLLHITTNFKIRRRILESRNAAPDEICWSQVFFMPHWALSVLNLISTTTQHTPICTLPTVTLWHNLEKWLRTSALVFYS